MNLEIRHLRDQITLMMKIICKIPETFDRLEVAELSARSLIESTTIGVMVPMNEQEIEDLKKKFLT